MEPVDFVGNQVSMQHAPLIKQLEVDFSTVGCQTDQLQAEVHEVLVKDTIIKEVPVPYEVIKEVIKEVQVEVIKEVTNEVTKEVPVVQIKEVEVIKEVIVIEERIKEVEVIREVIRQPEQDS